MKKVLALILSLILALSLAGVAAAEANEDFTLGYNGVVTLNPLMTQASNDHNVFYLTQLQLVRYYNSELFFDGAEKCDMNEDATVFTFTLRDGLKWSDGTDLTANDYAYYLSMLLDPEFGSPSAQKWYIIKNSSAYSTGSDESIAWEDVGVKVLDDRTLELTLEYPMSSFLDIVATKHIYPINQAFAESVGLDKLGSSVDTMLYSGAYVMTDWVLESSIDMVKNDLYWNAADSFPVKNLHLVEVEDPNTEIAMFENGELDAVEQISSQYYGYIPDCQIGTVGGGFQFLWMNQNGTSEEAQKLMSNVNFRQALNYGFNRDATVALVDAAAVAANRPIDPNFSGTNGGSYVDEYPVETVPTAGDTEKAKEYLAAAMEELGYSDVSELPQLTFVSYENAQIKSLCETIIDQWKQNLGISSIQLVQYTIGTAIGTFYDLTYDIFLISWETEALPTDILQCMATGGECNAGIWSDETYDDLVKQAVAAIDPVEKATLTQQAEQRFLDLAVVQPIYLQGYIHLAQPYVSNFMIQTRNGYEFDQLTIEK